MVLSSAGTGERQLFASYIREVPIWKSTHRLVISDKGTPLQGWAIVDNTIGEDWTNVECRSSQVRPNPLSSRWRVRTDCASRGYSLSFEHMAQADAQREKLENEFEALIEKLSFDVKS